VAKSSAVSPATSREAEVEYFVRGLPFTSTIAAGEKFEPLTVSSSGAAPAIALSGEMEVICGGALLTANCSWFDRPESALSAITDTAPAVAIRDAEIVAVNC
jgi:hypothetical protein